MIGMNIRHVVSAIDSIKTLAGDLLGLAVPLPSFETLLMYFYTITEERSGYQMPRRHKPTIKRLLPLAPRSEAGKTRYPSRQAALMAAKEQQKYELHATLRVYRSQYDGFWYLTSRAEEA